MMCCESDSSDIDYDDEFQEQRREIVIGEEEDDCSDGDVAIERLTDRMHHSFILRHGQGQGQGEDSLSSSPSSLSLWRFGSCRRDERSESERQVKAKWALEELIDEQLDRYRAHCNNRSMVPTWPNDVARVIMPEWVPPHELASLSWFGDWRPTAVLDLLRGLARRSSAFPSAPAVSSGAESVEPLLSQLIHEVGIEETVLDEQMAEVQANCILHLPFRHRRTGAAALGSVLSEMRKIEQVIAKAQELRSKALELLVNKVLSQTEAAEFLVAFAGIQDLVHQFAAEQQIRKGPVSVRAKRAY